MIPRVRSREHLQYVRDRGCLICADNTCDAAHIRAGYKPAGKPQTGMGIKPADCYVVGLCRKHHDEQHQIGNEAVFWDNYHIGLHGAIFIAQALFCNSGNYEIGEEIVSWWRR